MLRQRIGFPLIGVGPVFQGADNGEEDRGVTLPISRIGIPQVFGAGLRALDGGELRTVIFYGNL